jgi:hypothetical protein
MRVRHTLPAIAFISAVAFAGVGAFPAPAAAQDRGYQGQARQQDYSAALRFSVSPNRAEVFVDGSYAGRVDDFDGVFQRLRVRPGYHNVEFYLDGYRTIQERIYAQPNASRTISLSLQPLARGERAYGRPVDHGHGDWWDARSNSSSARFGTVSLGLAPYDSEVWVDGRRWSNNGNGRGRNERMALRLDPGRHHIEVRRAGYQTYARDVNVATGATVTVNVTLRHG